MSLNQFNHITCFVFDVDGVLTDGSLWVMPGGVHVRKMNIKDGYALQLAVKKGYRILVISGGDSPEVKERLNKLGVTDVYMQVKDKLQLFNEWLATNSISANECLYMGDDIPDMGLMRAVGMPCCPADAVQEIKATALYISVLKGGEGCVREVIEKVMKLRDDWNDDFLVSAQ